METSRSVFSSVCYLWHRFGQQGRGQFAYLCGWVVLPRGYPRLSIHMLRAFGFLPVLGGHEQNQALWISPCRELVTLAFLWKTLSFVLRCRDAARTVWSFGVLLSEEGVHAAGRKRNQHHPQPSEAALPALWGCFSQGFLSPMPYWVLSSKLKVGGSAYSAGHCPWTVLSSPSSAPLLLAAFGSLALAPPLTYPAAWMPTPAITRGSPKPHLTYRVLDTTALSALFQRRINPDPVTPLWWVQRAVFSPRQLPFSFLHFMALHGSNSVIMFIFPYQR